MARSNAWWLTTTNYDGLQTMLMSAQENWQSSRATRAGVEKASWLCKLSIRNVAYTKGLMLLRSYLFLPILLSSRMSMIDRFRKIDQNRLHICCCCVTQCEQTLKYKLATKTNQKLPKSNYTSLCMKMDVFKRAQKVNIHLGYFCEKICHQELSKIPQSGHAGCVHQNHLQLVLPIRLFLTSFQSSNLVGV